MLDSHSENISIFQVGPTSVRSALKMFTLMRCLNLRFIYVRLLTYIGLYVDRPIREIFPAEIFTDDFTESFTKVSLS